MYVVEVTPKFADPDQTRFALSAASQLGPFKQRRLGESRAEEGVPRGTAPRYANGETIVNEHEEVNTSTLLNLKLPLTAVSSFSRVVKTVHGVRSQRKYSKSFIRHLS